MHVRIHDTDRSQDMRNMGGLATYLPVTRWTFLLSCLAIAGVPPLSGFWSKDEILWKAYSVNVTTNNSTTGFEQWTWPPMLGPVIYWVGIVAATMTSFYMFRAYFMTFHGRFRGWKIVKSWKDPGHDHGHDHHEEGPLEGPVPQESPAAMTVPLMILAAMAVVAGFLNAHPIIHFAPLGHLLDPIFAKASLSLAERPGLYPELLMMAPGLLAFAVGGGLAWSVYETGGGKAERDFAQSFPRLYRLMYDKWRIDELYDATVVGMVDALADIFTMADKWIIDGILARVSAGVVSLAGTILRAFQTGRVQAYSAAMVIGMAGVAWFLGKAHADITIDDSAFRTSGQLTLSAPAGVGYHYKWVVTNPAAKDAKPESSEARELTVTLNPGDQKEVVLEVENVFKSTATEHLPLNRAAPPTMISAPAGPAGAGTPHPRTVAPVDVRGPAPAHAPGGAR
jgi:NADH-quinone oxidoreductase subunit L